MSKNKSLYSPKSLQLAHALAKAKNGKRMMSLNKFEAVKTK